MTVSKWLKAYADQIKNRHFVVFGATGGLGRALCFHIAGCDGQLLLVARNREKADALKASLLKRKPDARVDIIIFDMTDYAKIPDLCRVIAAYEPHALVFSAGIYHVPRTKAGDVDVVFAVNCMAVLNLTAHLNEYLLTHPSCHIVAVGSIAYRYSDSRPDDVDFSREPRCHKVYGNSKRYLMGCLPILCKEYSGQLSVVHPGISYTEITKHYPKWLFPFIKYPMKLIFMKPKKACLSLIAGCFDHTENNEWIGPKFLDIWGFPQKSAYRGISDEERKKMWLSVVRLLKRS